MIRQESLQSSNRKIIHVNRYHPNKCHQQRYHPIKFPFRYELVVTGEDDCQRVVVWGQDPCFCSKLYSWCWKAIVENVVSRLVELEIPKGQSLWLSGVLLMCRLYKMERPSTQKVGNNQIFNRSGWGGTVEIFTTCTVRRFWNRSCVTELSWSRGHLVLFWGGQL